MEKVQSANHTFEVVDEIPSGYSIWNIGKNMIDGYLPLVQTGGHDGCQVLSTPKKAIKIEGAQTILLAIMRGENTLKKMENCIRNHYQGKKRVSPYHIERLEKAVVIMRQIKGIEKLDKK